MAQWSSRSAAWALAVAVTAALVSPASAAEPGAAGSSSILKTLRPGHPRLFITKETLPALRQAVQTDPTLAAILKGMRHDAEWTLNQPPVEYKLIGPRLLDKSRRCLDRVSTLSLVYVLTGERKYADRAMKELEAAAAFPDWHPPHFLDTAEMTCAFGIGYDWLYDYMTPTQRATVRQAIVEKGLKPGLDLYRKHSGFSRVTNNWSQVCNGGLAVGAMAIADEEPGACAEVLESGLKAVQGAMANFGPDGSWNEGPGYWGYTLQYTSYYCDALRTALGSMMSLDQAPGLSEAGVFRIYCIGPTGRSFNFADAHESGGGSSAMFWLARTFKKPMYAAFQRPLMRNNPFDLLWFSREGQGSAASGLPLNKYFRKDDIVFLRGDWDDPKALWVGFKGGDNAASHSHLDIGSFVLEALGQRWAVDLGSDDYNLPAYFGNKRWTYYRLKTDSHNTLLINGENQATRAKAPVVAFSNFKSDGAAVADLSAAYPQAQHVLRGVGLLGGKRILVQDEIEAAKGVEVLWGMVTNARVDCKGPAAVLEQKGKRLYAKILSPDGAKFETVSANPPPPERQQPEARKLVVRLPDKVTNLTLAVVFSPEESAVAPGARLKPLRDWPGWLPGAPRP